ncbi:Adenylate/guanylate cyclase [Sterolibacterium denitrificans]|uniref:Adenylate/guanylate cyclase n=2 Tax=Sterolibacterium denitrificans TaxID=157592 RepID=A0A7Z7HRQ7_9PROT|nr:Adenylate/guanylate cyclase [Sterolibacterium denitrificans]
MSDTESAEPRAVMNATEMAYGRFVPHQLLRLLKRPSIIDVQLGDHVEQEMSLLFSDIRDFTTLSESILPAENFRFINSYLSTMEPVVGRHNGIIDKYIGDGIMALFPGSADDAVRSGIDMLNQLTTYNIGRSRAGFVPIRIGIGINTGLVMMGTVGGHNRMDSTVIGDAVNLASRLEGLTKNYGTPLVISANTLHALEDQEVYNIRFIDRLRIKGRYQSQAVYEVFDADPEPLRLAKQATLHDFEEALACYHLGRADLAQPLLQECLRITPDDRAVRVYLERCKDFLRLGPGEHELPMEKEVDWRREYSIGIREIDTLHQEQLSCIARLERQVEAGDSAAASASLDSFAEHNALLNSSVENLMQRYNYPFITDHLKQHAAFDRAFAELRREIEAGARNPLYLLFRIRLLLADWQINHTTKSDLHLGHFLQRAGVS